MTLSRIVAETSDFTTQNPELAQMLPDYVENCVIGDILLNGKYTINQLLNSTDPLTLITSNPSPLRGIFKMTSTSRQFLTCQQAATEIKTLVNTDVNPGSATFTWLTRKVFGNKLNGAALLSNAMGESYGYFYSGGMTAAQIMKNNITNSAVRQGIKGFAARSSDTANLLNLATENAATKQRLSWAAGNQDTAALFQAIASGGGRAVSMGDIDQFEAVDVGAPFKLMQERSPMDVAIMKEIVRQKDVQLRGAVHDIIDNRIDAALQRLETQPADRVARSASATLPVSAIQETETPVTDIVADWTDRTPEARSRTLIIAQLNADRKAINAGIHAALAARGELGEKAITVPVLDKITHTRHEFNKTAAWQPGMVVKRGDRYQDVLAVDRNGSTVTVRDEEGKIGLYSPKELITGDVQLFRRSEMEVRAGDLLKFTATDKEQGQMANQRYTVESVSETGTIRLKGENGRVTINPENVRSQQHIDYGWAVTGYGAQGASTDYVIALEGTEGGRKALATRRAFYISTSRVKEHVQIYTDGKADWVKAIKTPERDIKTAHDALAPETQRKQAKAIWAMGQPVNKTAIGRAWVRHQGMQEASLTAKIIPATRRFPEPALALPVYDNNGRSAGLALVSLVASPEGRMTQGETRMVMTERARGAVLQRSQSGNTIVASDLTAALDAVRHHPKDGVVWQTGDEPPSAHLLKVSGGIVTEAASEHKLIRDQEETTRQTEKDMLNKAAKAEKEKSETQERIVVPVEDAVRIMPGMLEVDDRNEPTIPDGKVLIQVASSDSVSHDEISRHIRAEKEPLASKVASERAGVSRIVNELANTERDIIRQPENSERGRMPEREEQTPTRTIQKER